MDWIGLAWIFSVNEGAEGGIVVGGRRPTFEAVSAFPF